MSPEWRKRAAGVLVAASLVGWPLSALTLAKDEPQFVLGLSWLAITLTCADILASTDVRATMDGDDQPTKREGMQ